MGRSKPAIPSPGSVAGRQSLCELLRAVIETGLNAGLSGRRLFQDLCAEPRWRETAHAGSLIWRSDRRLIPMSRCSLELFCTRRNLRLQVQPGQLNLRKWP